MGNTTRIRAQANRIKGEALRSGQSADKRLRALLDTAADVLKEIHGGSWLIRIDHAGQAAFICRDFPANDRIQPSQLREIV